MLGSPGNRWNVAFVVLVIVVVVVYVVVVVVYVVVVILLLIPQTYLQSLVKIKSGTAEILMTLSLCGGLKSFSCQTQLLSWVGVVTIVRLSATVPLGGSGSPL